MPKYHINNQNQLLPCMAASEQDCEFLEESHFDNIMDAVAALDKAIKGDLGESPLESTKEKFKVESISGKTLTLREGERTEQALMMLDSQQSLALAVEIAKQNGSNKVVVVLDESSSGEHLFDNDGNYAVDGHGEQTFVMDVAVYKVYAVDTDGHNYWDVDGFIAPEVAQQFFDEGFENAVDSEFSLVQVSVAEAKKKYSHYLPPQNYAFAKTFVEGVLSRGRNEVEVDGAGAWDFEDEALPVEQW